MDTIVHMPNGNKVKAKSNRELGNIKKDAISQGATVAYSGHRTVFSKKVRIVEYCTHEMTEEQIKKKKSSGFNHMKVDKL